MQLTIPQIQQLLHVEAYDLATFLQKVEEGVKQGYQISLDYNETFPYGTIGHYIVKMLPVSLQQELQGKQTPTERLKPPLEASEVEKTTLGTTDEVQTVVGASKKAAGRPAKVK